jgi:RNA recognition motif-containing protein
MVECKSMGAHESDQEPQASVDEWKRKGAVQSDVDLTQRRVFLGGLSQDTSAKGLKKALRAFGKVEGATVHLNKVTGKSRGFGFVTFVQVEAAQLAVEKEMHEIDVRRGSS